MNIERRLTEGVAGWLFFEDHCNKSGLFSERYMSFPIGQILNSVYGSHVHAEYIHPVLSQYSLGRGAKPKIDFAVLNAQHQPELAIETKWIGQTIPSVESILWDLIRLETLSRQLNTNCIFMLGGRRKDLEVLFASEEFRLKKSAHPRPILHDKYLGLSSVSVMSTDPAVVNMWRPIMRKAQTMGVPTKIGTQLTKPFPIECKSDQFQVYCWKVFKTANASVFIPKNTKYYRT
ncbi:hypothetical protein ACFGVR_08500 [Mucilaginibacter sp. AW1-3]